MLFIYIYIKYSTKQYQLTSHLTNSFALVIIKVIDELFKLIYPNLICSSEYLVAN